ncbi:neuropeptide CCHamide-1 [Drosophila kikkawai]|uniref:Neuropeptide CCHamide-1 n=1 Tax=Drosophila kikkawai TaxID=30033 RepID=A0A6P4IUI1_DROKI|nr:neuropeptide CCHamide-1 [Drosophila kikkawai]
MWYIKCSWTLLVLVTLFALVTGSCLEYGHSCWGAHGKRSGGKALEDSKQRPGPNTYALDALAEQLYTNNQNNQNPEDNNDDNSNSGGPLAAAPLSSALQARRVEEERNRIGNGNGLKWTQLLRQHRYQLRQLQQQQEQQQQLGRGRGSPRGYDAAAESWRKLQQAVQNQDLLLEPSENEEQPVYELKK